jgi:Tfp pilus assembly protein PilF
VKRIGLIVLVAASACVSPPAPSEREPRVPDAGFVEATTAVRGAGALLLSHEALQRCVERTPNNAMSWVRLASSWARKQPRTAQTEAESKRCYQESLRLAPPPDPPRPMGDWPAP